MLLLADLAAPLFVRMPLQELFDPNLIVEHQPTPIYI
jgi:hypothetical protein